MAAIFKPLTRLFSPHPGVPAGIYHYQAPASDPRNYRLHLRVEEDGRGILIVNAATVLHLNETATEYAYHFVHNQSADEVARWMSRRYRVDAERARQDYLDFAQRVLTLIETPDLDPVTFLDFERRTPYSRKLSAPYRLDCAITYRLPEGTEAQFAPTKRVERELSTAEWFTIMDKAWQVGIPHIVFTGGEPTLRDDLPELIAHAESNGQVSGLLTDGLKLAEAAYFQKLLQTGLDHVMIAFQPENPTAWKALEAVIPADIFAAVHLTVTLDNKERMAEVLNRLAEKGMAAISLSASDASLGEELIRLRDLTSALHMRLVWDMPVPYSALNPVAVELQSVQIEGEGPVRGAGQIEAVPKGEGRAWLYVEPDGDVLPAQGVNRVLGNLLRDEWEKIWKAGQA